MNESVNDNFEIHGERFPAWQEMSGKQPLKSVDVATGEAGQRHFTKIEKEQGKMGERHVVDQTRANNVDQVKGQNVYLASKEQVKKFRSAMREGDVEKAKQLINAHPEIANGCKAIYLHPLEMASCHPDQKKRLIFLQMILEKNPSLDFSDENGNTLLHRACLINDRTHIVPTLLQKGASINHPNNSGVTAYQIAKMFHYVTLAEKVKPEGIKKVAQDVFQPSSEDMQEIKREQIEAIKAYDDEMDVMDAKPDVKGKERIEETVRDDLDEYINELKLEYLSDCQRHHELLLDAYSHYLMDHLDTFQTELSEYLSMVSEGDFILENADFDMIKNINDEFKNKNIDPPQVLKQAYELVNKKDNRISYEQLIALKGDAEGPSQ